MALGESPNVPGSCPRPDAILLNGGVFNSPKIAGRLCDVLNQWWPESPPVRLLHHSSLELAVARGAAEYGLVRRGLGRRITGGAAHALYIGLEKAGTEASMALCVIPRGQEEGERIDLGERVFQLTLGRPVRFPLFSSSSDRVERAGAVVELGDDMNPLPPIHTVLKSSEHKAGSVPVHLRSALTEIGTLELWCVSNSSSEQWRLEFELRGAASGGMLAVTESMPPRFTEARTVVERVFGSRPRQGPAGSGPSPAKEAKGTWTNLEKTLGPREEWPVPALRELWSVVLAGAARRRRSADHERVFFQLLGYSLRPGFGYPLDEWRCEQTASLFADGIQFSNEKPVWAEFWILWRRIAGGLSEARHREIWSLLQPHLAHRVPPHPPRNVPKPKGIQPEGVDEMVRLGGALEHLEASDKSQLGNWISARFGSSGTAQAPWIWGLGRLGARVPIYGSAHKVVDPAQAAEWLRFLLRPDLVKTDGALFAAAQLARLTGDRARDLEEDVRRQTIEALRAGNAPASWLRMVSEVVTLEAGDKARALGDTLPVGLQLV
jgi:hypothetical protein